MASIARKTRKIRVRSVFRVTVSFTVRVKLAELGLRVKYSLTATVVHNLPLQIAAFTAAEDSR